MTTYNIAPPTQPVVLEPTKGLRLAPSMLANYFHFSCDRNLLFSVSGLDRHVWYYKKSESGQYVSLDPLQTVKLSLERNLDQVLLGGDAKVDLTARTLSISDATYPLIKSSWLAKKNNKSVVPLDENTCAALEDASNLPSSVNKPKIAVIIDSQQYLADVDSMQLHPVEKEGPEVAAKSLKLKRVYDQGKPQDYLRKAFKEGGERWEQHILQILAERGDKVWWSGTIKGESKIEGEEPTNSLPDARKVSDFKMPQAEFVKLLQTDLAQWPATSYVYQPMIEATPTLYKQLDLIKEGVDSPSVLLSRCYPDFLYIEKRDNGDKSGFFLEITIVDAKASDRVKLSHRIQVGVYYLYLSALLSHFGLEAKVKVNEKQGAVWLRPKPHFDTFNLSSVLPSLRSFFLDGSWSKIATTSLSEVMPQLSKRCFNCFFFGFCKTAALEEQRDPSLVYDMSSYDSRYITNYLEQHGHIKEGDSPHIEEIDKFLSAHLSTLPDRVPLNSSQNKIRSNQRAAESASPSPSSEVGIQTSRRSSRRSPASAEGSPSMRRSARNSPTSSNSGSDDQPSRSASTKDISAASPTPAVAVTISPPTTLPPLNANLWLSLMKLKAYVKNQPEFISLPTRDLPPDEDISVVLNILIDRPNNHLLGWSISVGICADSPFQHLISDLYDKLTSLDLDWATLSGENGATSKYVHISAVLVRPVWEEVDWRVNKLTTQLVLALFYVLNVSSGKSKPERDGEEESDPSPAPEVAPETPKPTLKIWTFSPPELAWLQSTLFTLAQDAQFVPSNSLEVFGPPSDGKVINLLALKLFCSLFKSSPESIALPRQPEMRYALIPTISALRPTITSLVALPKLFFFADFDEFLASMTGAAAATPPVTSQALNQTDLLRLWYSLAKKKTDIDTLRNLFHGHLQNKSVSMFSMVQSLRDMVMRTSPATTSSSNEGKALNPLFQPAIPFAWTYFRSTCDESAGKLLFVSDYDLLTEASDKRDARRWIAIGMKNVDLGDRVVALIYTGVREMQRGIRGTGIVFSFEADVVSDSMASSLQEDAPKDGVLETSPLRKYLLCCSSTESLEAAIAHDDFYRRLPGDPKDEDPFAYVSAASFAKKEGKYFIELYAGTKDPNPALFGKTMLGKRFYLSERQLDLIQTRLNEALVKLDLSMAFFNAFKRLTDPALSKAHLSQFLTWFQTKFLAEFYENASIRKSTPSRSLKASSSKAGKDESRKLMKLDWEALSQWELAVPAICLFYFKAMGGVEVFFLEHPNSENTDFVRLTKRGCALIRKTWQTTNNVIIESISSALDVLLRLEKNPSPYDVPYALIKRPIEWGSTKPINFEKDVQARFDMLTASFLSGTQEGAVQSVLTAQQGEVLSAVNAHRLTCVWGPPGTGKTYFLSHLVMLYLEAHRKIVVQDVVQTLSSSTPGSSPSVRSSRSRKSTPSASPAPSVVQHRHIGGSPYRILIVAFTHSALDTVVKALMEKDKAYRSEGGVFADLGMPPLAVARLFTDDKNMKSSIFFQEEGSIAAEAVPTALTTQAELLAFWHTNNDVGVVASTPWSWYKHAPLDLSLDMIIFDEASQLFFSQGLLMTQWLNPQSGRLVVAGDHRQLPPISRAEYPDLDPSLQASIIYSKSMFEYLQYHDADSKTITKMLQENWRASSSLVDLPAKLIYSSDYRPAIDAIAKQKYWLEHDSGHHWKITLCAKKQLLPIQHPLLQLLFDASKPMVVIMLKQSRHSVSLDVHPQSKLIARMICAVRLVQDYIETLPSDDEPGDEDEVEEEGEEYEEDGEEEEEDAKGQQQADEEFWRSQLLVVAPHHAQRYNIKEHMRMQDKSWSYPWSEAVPAIQTVEKAQGREFNAVIADYGFVDEYQISKELSFLYSENRINVAQTRAKKKCIVFVSDRMLQISRHVFQHSSIERGFQYLQNMVKWAKENQVLHELPLDAIEAECQAIDQDELFTFLASASSDASIEGLAADVQTCNI